jgi:L-alanine-DL-glutamate epimerase-like enolase superfamily enzyme
MKITRIESIPVTVPTSGPLVWSGGTRSTGSGLVIQIHTDEGLIGLGEAPGPTLPAIQVIVEQELAQFLIGEDPARITRLVGRMEEFTRNWNQLATYAIAGIEMALLDLLGKSLDTSVAQLLGGAQRDLVPYAGYLFIDDPEVNARKAREFVAAGCRELKLKCGRDLDQDDQTVAAIRDAVGSDIALRLDPNMNWSVPTAIRWIRALSKYDIQYVEQPVPDTDLRGMAEVRRATGVPIAADEACTTMRSVLELLRAEACDVFVIYTSEAGGLLRAAQIAAVVAAAGKWCTIGSWAELGIATMANAHVACTSDQFAFANDTHYPLQTEDVLTERLDLSAGHIALPGGPGLGVTLDEAGTARLAGADLRQSVFYDEIGGDAPRIGQVL